MSRTRPRRPRAGLVGLLTGGLLAGLVVAAPSAGAGTTNPVLDPAARRMVSGWMPYWTPDASLASVEAHAELFGDVTGFWHSAAGASTINDQLSDTRRVEIVAAVHAKGVRILGAVTDGTAPRAMAAILTSTTARAAHVKALVALAEANHYDGIDLDYEKFAFSDGSATWAVTRPAWVAFVKELSAALHAKGLWLTVSVPVMYDSDRDASSGYWVYDYAGIGPYVDRLRIMTYDYSVSSPGPIAPIAWVRRVLDYATTQVSPGKIQVGVPAYGRDWPGSTTGCPVNNVPVTDSLTSREAEALAASQGITPTWSSTYAERTFSYTKTYSGLNANNKPASCTVQRTVWFEEASATLRRAELVGEYQLSGIAQWSVGGEAAGQWSRLGDYARSITRVSPRVELFAGDVVYGGVVNVHATVRFASGAPVVGEDWTLSWRDRDSTAWTAVASGTTSSAGTMSAPRKPTRTGYWRLWVGGSWSRYSAQTEQNRTLVRTKVVAGLSRTSVTKGSTVTVKGTIAPAVTGLVVQRQRLVGGSWVDVGHTTTTVSGKFALPVVTGGRGTYTYRVRVSGAVYRGNGYSPRMILTVS